MTNTTNTTADLFNRKPSSFLVAPISSLSMDHVHRGIPSVAPESYDTAEQAEAAALAMAQRLFCRVQILSLYAVVEARPEIVKQQDQ